MSALLAPYQGRYSLVGVASDVPWGKASTGLVNLIYEQQAIGHGAEALEQRVAMRTVRSVCEQPAACRLVHLSQRQLVGGEIELIARDGSARAHGVTSATAARRRRLATRMFAASGAEDPAAMGRLLSDRATATGAVNWYRTMRVKGAPGAGRVSVPSLYVWSDGDAALGREAAERTRDFVDGDYTFVELAGASHWIPDERPEELAAAVLAHLERHPEEA